MAKVLVVEDEEDVRIFYQKMISDMGHEVFAAKDAEEAKSAILSGEDLDVALVDYVLPGKENGLDILRLIQVSQPFCQTILVTGYPTVDSASEALRCSAFDYLTKPVRKTQLGQVVAAAVKEKLLQEEKLLDAETNKRGYDELKAKQEMLRHDMRSLLIGIIGFANLLINKTSLNEVQLEYCKQIQQYGIQLENMVTTYLDISNLEQETFQLHKTTFNLLDIVKQSRKTLHFPADEKNIDLSIIYNKKLLSIDDVLPFEGSRMYLQNAIDNLLRNAIEASPPDRRVKIKIKEANEHVSIAIHNWGTVPKNVHSRFFEKYTTSGKKNGLGLGTYMAKLVVEAHGGQISVSSSKDNGTEVWMTLPLHQ